MNAQSRELTFLLNPDFSGQVLPTDLLLLEQIGDLVEELLRLLVVLQREVTSRGNEVVCSVTPTKERFGPINGDGFHLTNA